MTETYDTNKNNEHFRLGGGPHKLGDPNDRRLRKVERDVVIPKQLREAAIKKCSDVVEKFVDCSKKYGLRVTKYCKEENLIQINCIIDWMENKEFQNEITEKYLNDRSNFRRTGIPKYKN